MNETISASLFIHVMASYINVSEAFQGISFTSSRFWTDVRGSRAQGDGQGNITPGTHVQLLRTKQQPPSSSVRTIPNLEIADYHWKLSKLYIDQIRSVS